MRSFLIRVVIYAVAVWLTAIVLPGIRVSNDDLGTLLIIGFVFGLVSAFIKPIVRLLSCPFVLITMGLFTLCINGFMLQLVAWFVGDRLNIDNFLWAILGGIMIAVVGFVLERLLDVNRPARKRR